MRPIVIVFLLMLATSMILIPVFFVTVLNQNEPLDVKAMEEVELEIDQSQSISVSVFRNATSEVETYPLEEYVRGVIAAEMPIDFELEALKAQAMAARTYIVKRIIDKSFSNVPDGAMVTDTVKHQVFYSDDQLKKLWGYQYDARISKLNQAINETNGRVITYQGKPIDALFFSTSNGFTENSEDYWKKEVPYLKSVTSPWDLASPKFNNTTSVSFAKLKSEFNVDPAILTTSGQEWIKITNTTAGNRVKQIRIGDKVLTGRELREMLDLYSSSFSWEITEDEVTFYTRGYGHGVGMSQYGANGMAKEGKTAEEIVQYYYTGVNIKNIKDWIKIKQ